MRPVIYLDVDGVLNAYEHHRFTPPEDCYQDFEVHPDIDGFQLTLSKQMMADIVALDVDVAWLTTWGEDAAKLVAPLVGAPDWPHLAYGFGTPTMTLLGVSKLDVLVEDQLERSRPFVWVDDQECTRAAVRELRERLDAPSCMLLQPEPRTGLRPSQLVSVRSFLESVA